MFPNLQRTFEELLFLMVYRQSRRLAAICAVFVRLLSSLEVYESAEHSSLVVFQDRLYKQDQLTLFELLKQTDCSGQMCQTPDAHHSSTFLQIKVTQWI